MLLGRERCVAVFILRTKAVELCLNVNVVGAAHEIHNARAGQENLELIKKVSCRL